LPEPRLNPRYTGRFAPSPTGPLHAGSLVAALASWLDARASGGTSGGKLGGTWLVRIEDVDTPRCLPGMDAVILQQLAACGLVPDAPPTYQSQRSPRYQQALDQLVASAWAYPCACSRKEIEAACAAQGQMRHRNAELVYPGTCRNGLWGRPARAWRMRTEEFKENRPPALIPLAQVAIKSIVDSVVTWHDRLLGPQQQNLSQEVGDFVLRRADGLWAYQLAVVVDDAAQGITHVVRGQDLADNTPRQIWLQQALALPTPQYLHTPLVWGPNGEKLSKQNGAQALDLAQPLATLNTAAKVLGLAAGSGDVASALAQWVEQWKHLHNG
jgi:glutamyl-Q tRNA(Asp) synthetase